MSWWGSLEVKSFHLLSLQAPGSSPAASADRHEPPDPRRGSSSAAPMPTIPIWSHQVLGSSPSLDEWKRGKPSDHWSSTSHRWLGLCDPYDPDVSQHSFTCDPIARSTTTQYLKLREACPICLRRKLTPTTQEMYRKEPFCIVDKLFDNGINDFLFNNFELFLSVWPCGRSVHVYI